MIVYRGFFKAIVYRDMWQSCIVEWDPIVTSGNRVPCLSCNRGMAIVGHRAIVTGAHRAIVQWIRPWAQGPTVPWTHAPMGAWAHLPMSPWACEPMGPWAHKRKTCFRLQNNSILQLFDHRKQLFTGLGTRTHRFWHMPDRMVPTTGAKTDDYATC